MELTTFMKIQCKVWCFGRSQQEIDMGLPEGDEWMDYCFDIHEVESIKLCGEHSFLGNDKCTLNFKSGQTVTIDKTFSEMITIFIQTKC